MGFDQLLALVFLNTCFNQCTMFAGRKFVVFDYGSIQTDEVSSFFNDVLRCDVELPSVIRLSRGVSEVFFFESE